MLIVEDILLLATDDTTGKVSQWAMNIDAALAGAVLIDLAMAGRVRLDGQEKTATVVVTDGSPIGDPVLDPALEQLGEKDPMRPASALGRIGKNLRDRVHTSLEDKGVLRRESGKVLGIFPTTRWPAQDSAHEAGIRHQVSNALLLGQEPDARVAAIISVLVAADMLRTVVDKAEAKAAKERGKVISDGNWAADGVRTSIQEMQAAISAAVMVSTTVAITASTN
jgi:Golgi phosphoprotein 3 (GPP34)